MPPDSRVAFGPFVLDAAERRLLRDGQPVAVPPRPLSVLVRLAETPERLVTKDDLLEAVWGDAVVDENALTVAVSKLRAALGDGAGCVETVPRFGYRFVPERAGAAAPPAGGGPPAPPLAAPVRAEPVPTARASPRPWRALSVGGGVLAALALAALVVRDAPPDRRPIASAAASPSTDAPPTLVPPGRAAAVEAVRQGRAVWATRRDWAAAYEHFREATGRDSTYAPAFVGLADVYALQYASATEAEAAVGRALALDPELPDAHATLGFVRALQRWDWAGADAAFDRALDLDPDHPKALQWQATVHMIQRRPADAEALLDRALRREPQSASLWSDLCEVRYTARRFRAAREACGRALDLDPAFPFAHQHLFWIDWLDGRPDAALRRAALLRAASDETPRPSPAELAADDGRAYLRWWTARVRAGDLDTSDLALAKHLALLGDDAAALDALDRAVERRLFLAPFAPSDPAFDGLRETPRFREIVSRMNL